MTDISPQKQDTPSQGIYEILYRRKSIRAFRPEPVPRQIIERILTAAARAPSGTNTQPWQVRILTGAARQRLVDAVLSFRNEHPGVEKWGYDYYPKKWKEPYLARRRKLGLDMYALLGIARGEEQRMLEQLNRNFAFFDAPVGMIFSIDRDLERGSWLDYGMFIQSIALAAEGEGLSTCLQGFWVAHADIVADTLAFRPEEELVCGLALGYSDPDAPINRLCSERAPLADFASFLDG